jgi:hypothetical protein
MEPDLFTYYPVRRASSITGTARFTWCRRDTKSSGSATLVWRLYWRRRRRLNPLSEPKWAFHFQKDYFDERFLGPMRKPDFVQRVRALTEAFRNDETVLLVL